MSLPAEWFRRSNISCWDRSSGSAVAAGVTCLMFSPVLNLRRLGQPRLFARSVALDLALVVGATACYRGLSCWIDARVKPTPTSATEIAFMSGAATGAVLGAVSRRPPNSFLVYTLVGGVAAAALTHLGVIP